MQPHLFLSAALLAAAVGSVGGASGPTTLAEAAAAARLAPEAFPGLPAQIAGDLASRGCTIPQSYIGSEPHNAIQGRFYRPDQTDWAILCSRDGRSVLLIYPGGGTREVEELGDWGEDQVDLEPQLRGPPVFGFLRKISPVDAEYILRHYEAYGGPTPPPIDHEGIDDGDVEKASGVWYWYEGRWLQLTGAD